MSDRERNTGPRMTDAEFERLRAFINSRAGLAFDLSAKSTIERRISERLETTESRDFSSYLNRLESDVVEQDALFFLVTTKETYFFRQDYQLSAFSHELLPRIVRSHAEQRRITVWSAGCSTGEEAYTIAILLLESGITSDFHVRVVGTDLCAQNVETAERGVYRRTSFRTTEKRYLDRYFNDLGGGTFGVKDEVKRLCQFGRANLLSPLAVRTVGRVDVAFCRNVLIYMDEESRTRVTDGIYQRLVPGGYLLLGHSESLLGGDSRFTPVHLEKDLVYQRPLIASRSGRITR